MEDGQAVSVSFAERIDQLLAFFLDSPENLGAVFLLILVLFFWLVSGAAASSIAEKRMRGRFLHFFAGLLFPVVYPLAIALVLKPPKSKRKKGHDIGEQGEDDLMRLDGPPPVVENRKRKPAGRGEDGLQTQSSIYNQGYFKDLSFDDAGRSRGPFSLIVQGVELRIERIVDPMPEMVIVETINADGKQQTLRIPYQQIESCREI